MYSFWPALAANIAGMLVVFATKYLCIGGPVIPLTFTLLMFIQGRTEAGIIGVVLTILSVYSHGGAILQIRSGRTKKNDVLGAIRKKLKM